MVVNVKKIAGYADTNSQGAMVYDAICDALESSSNVTVDFTGVPNATSSFVNSSFVLLLKKYDLATVQRRISVQGVNRQIAHMIKSRLEFEAA